MYADDTLLMSNADSMTESIASCQSMLDNMVKWCKTNKLTINIKKTKCMNINSRSESSSAIISIDGIKLDEVHQFEYLGMKIDSKLEMNKHVDDMYVKAKAKLN